MSRASASTTNTFTNGVRRAERAIAKLAAGTDTSRGTFAKAYRMCDHLDECVRFVTPETQDGWRCWLASEVLSGVTSRLRHAVTAARESAGRNAQAWRDAEIARLDAEIRAKRTLPESAYRLGWL